MQSQELVELLLSSRPRYLSQSLSKEPAQFNPQRIGEALAASGSAEMRAWHEHQSYTSTIYVTRVEKIGRECKEWDYTVVPANLDKLLSKLRQSWETRVGGLPTDYVSHEAISSYPVETTLAGDHRLPPADKPAWDVLVQLVEKCGVETGITDLAHQHDHYLYGKPKKE